MKAKISKTPVKKVVSKKPVAKKAISVAKKTVSVAKKAEKNFWLSFLGIANLVAFVAVVIVNYLATSLPIWWMSTWALSDLYPNLFVPIWLTFSIWWLIYLLILWFVVWQLVDLYKKNSLDITKKIGIWFILSCLTNIWWIFAWHYQQVLLSVGIMILFLIVLIVIAKKVSIGKKMWLWQDKLFLQVPFSVYLWRISVATIANVSTWLVNSWWGMWGMTDVFWTVVVIIVATLLAMISLWKKHDIVYALVIIWAFIWIILKRLTVDPVYAEPILRTLWICMIVISFGIGFKFQEWKKN